VASGQWPAQDVTVKQYGDLIAWQKAIDLVEEVYKITKAFPREEVYGLVSQMRRAAVSVPSNIAEGQSRSSKDFVHFLTIAHGSLSEVETQMIIANRLGYVTRDQALHFNKMASEVGRLINGLAKSINQLATGHRPLATSCK
jgi:four helix bundle protein